MITVTDAREASLSKPFCLPRKVRHPGRSRKSSRILHKPGFAPLGRGGFAQRFLEPGLLWIQRALIGGGALEQEPALLTIPALHLERGLAAVRTVVLLVQVVEGPS